MRKQMAVCINVFFPHFNDFHCTTTFAALRQPTIYWMSSMLVSECCCCCCRALHAFCSVTVNASIVTGLATYASILDCKHTSWSPVIALAVSATIYG